VDGFTIDEIWDALRLACSPAGLEAKRLMRIDRSDIETAFRFAADIRENPEAHKIEKPVAQKGAGKQVGVKGGAEQVFVFNGLDEQTIQDLLGPLGPSLGILSKDERAEFKFFDHTAQMADLVVLAGKFPSKAQARKNGFPGPIPSGLSRFVIGKGSKQLILWVANRMQDDVPLQEKWQ
jgi:hypothetical protein